MVNTSFQNAKKIITADDHEIFREGIRHRIESLPNIDIVAETSNGFQAVNACKKHKPDLVILDLIMPQLSGEKAMERIKKEAPDTRVLISTNVFEVIEAHKLLAKGANGFFLKQSSANEFITAVQTVLCGGSYLPSELLNELVEAAKRTRKNGNLYGLTFREIEILESIVKSDNNKEVAREFDISVRTVETHRQNIRRKTSVSTKEDLRKVLNQLNNE